MTRRAFFEKAGMWLGSALGSLSVLGSRTSKAKVGIDPAEGRDYGSYTEVTPGGPHKPLVISGNLRRPDTSENYPRVFEFKCTIDNPWATH